MDYLDPKKELQHRVLLMVGYLCIAVAITMAALVLLYQAYGFGIGKNGTLIQNGLTFFSSHPNPASIYVDGKLQKVRTNTRLPLPEGAYRISLAREGYNDWQRIIQLDGGSVEHFDYPFMIPKKLETKKVASYESVPSLVSQSPDRRWLLVNQAASPLNFDVYDLKNFEKPATTLTLPDSLTASQDGSWQLVDWADDNDHMLLKRMYGSDKYEYILVNRSNPDESVNLTQSLNITSPQVFLKDRKFDKYYLYNPADGGLQTVTQKNPTIIPVLDHVLAFKSYGDDTILYATSVGAPAGKVIIKLLDKTTTTVLRTFDAGSTYLVDLTKYSNTLYVALGSTSQNKVYVYEDPLTQLKKAPKQALVPMQVLHVTQPNYLSFSANAQYIVAENGQEFGVYDIENETGYRYTTRQPLDPPQSHAVWMDGNRLTYISAGKQLIFDYDYTNQHQLNAAKPDYLPAFRPNYASVYTFAPSADGTKTDLSQTFLLTPADR